MANYSPKKPYFSQNRVQLLAKDVLRECGEDRERALGIMDFFKDKVEIDPEDDRSKSELVKSLQLSMASNDRKLKVLEMMMKFLADDNKNIPKALKKVEEMSFDSVKLDALN